MLKFWRNSQPKRKPLDPIRLDVLRALEKPGCPICRVKREWLERFYIWLLIQDYYAETMMLAFKNSGGLCHTHAKRLMEIKSPYTTSVMYRYLVEDALCKLASLVQEARKESAKSPRRKPRRFSSAPTGECPACVEQHEIEQDGVRELVAMLDDSAMQDKYRSGHALCMPHCHLAVACASPEIVVVLTETQMERLEVMQRDFQEYFRKVDYRFANEPKGDEQTTWQRAIARFVGDGD